MSNHDASAPQPNNRSEGAGWEAPPEADLDNAMDQATALVGDLQSEVGIPEQAGHDDDSSSEATMPTLDVKLGELDELLVTAKTELGTKETSGAPKPPVAADIPDFMSEFTCSTAVPDKTVAATSAGTTAQPASQRTGSSSAGTAIGSDLRSPPTIPGNAQPPTSTPRASEHPASKTKAGATIEDDLMDLATSTTRVDRKTTKPMVGAASLLLDVLDRPFRWVGPTARSIVGWLALLMICAATVVFLINQR